MTGAASILNKEHIIKVIKQDCSESFSIYFLINIKDGRFS